MGLSLRSLATSAMVLAVALVFSGCGTPNSTLSSGGGQTTPVTEQAYEVKIATVGTLGPVLVDGQGITLYMFAADHQGQPSTCVDVCAVQWPPLTLPQGTAAPLAGPGINAALLNTSKRSDGSTQITYNGWPLYTWPVDSAPGQATGQGLNNLGGLWWVVDADGNPVTKH